MDLLSITYTLWRYKVVTLVVLLLTASGCYAVVAFVPPVYEARSSFLLVNPLPPPTEDQLRKNPALDVNANNPYLRFGDQGVIINVLAERLDNQAVRSRLVAEGVDARYAVAPSNQFGFTVPIVDITSQGDTPRIAMASAARVDAEAKAELRQQQKVFGAADRYLLTPLQVSSPNRATQRISARLRSLIAVAALGALVLFLLISVCVAVDKRREERAAMPGSQRSPQVPDGQSVSTGTRVESTW